MIGMFLAAPGMVAIQAFVFGAVGIALVADAHDLRRLRVSVFWKLPVRTRAEAAYRALALRLV